MENAFDDPERLLMEQKLNELRNTYKDIIFISFPGDEKGFLTSEHTGGCVLFGKITDVEKIISADDKINRP